MATFHQWSKSSQQVRRVTWLCGPEPALVAEVLAAVRAAVPASPSMLFAGDGSSEREIWDYLLSYPPAGQRLAVVIGASRLTDLAPVPALLSDPGLAGSRVVFVSGDDDFERGQDADGKRVLAPHLAALQASRNGQLIRCCAPSSAGDQAALVASWWPRAGSHFGYLVLEQCGRNLTMAWQACDKARRAGLAPTAQSALAVCLPDEGAGLADALIAGDKAAAMGAARQAGRDEIGSALSLLAARLTMLAELSEAARQGPAELFSRVRGDRFLARRMAPYARAYGPDKVRRDREVLAMGEAAWRDGATAGVGESLVVLW
jgi:hypothetical protein